MYSFLLQWAVNAIEKTSSQADLAPKSRARAKQSSQEGQSTSKNAINQLQNCLDVMCKVQKLKLSKLFVTTSERDLFIRYPDFIEDGDNNGF